MKVVIVAPLPVRRALSSAISAWNPRRDGPLQRIKVHSPRAALLEGEEPLHPMPLECNWALDRDPKTARPFWKVTVGPEDRVKHVLSQLEHDFDDPLDMR